MEDTVCGLWDEGSIKSEIKAGLDDLHRKKKGALFPNSHKGSHGLDTTWPAHPHLFLQPPTRVAHSTADNKNPWL